MMKPEEIRTLPWGEVDWSELGASGTGGFLFNWTGVTEKDIDTFVGYKFSEVARRLNVPYQEAEKILKEENKAFFNFKKAIYANVWRCEKDSEKLLSLQKIFVLPELPVNKVNQCKKMFDELSPAEKLEFLNNELNELKELIDLQKKMEGN